MNGKKTVLFQGDSITDVGRNNHHGSLSEIGQGYALICSAKLGVEYPLQYDFINRGISGNRMPDLYARIKCDVWNLNPDIISVLIGVNDVWHDLDGNGTEPERYYNLYRLFINETKAKLPGVKFIIMEPFVLEASATTENWEFFSTRVRENAALARKLAEETGEMFLPLQNIFDEAAKTAPNDYWLGDGVHPTIFGHQLIANEWLKAFKKLEGKN